MDSENRRELRRQYKERKQVGGVLRIVNNARGKSLLLAEPDLTGARNRFQFSVMTGSCVHPAIAQDWKEDGPCAFSFEVLEELEKKEDSTPAEYRQELQLLCDLWRERFPSESLYPFHRAGSPR